MNGNRRGPTRRLLLACVLACVAGAAGVPHRVAAEEPEPPTRALGDFGYAITLTPEGSSPVHSALIPLEVYRGVVHADLADVRVFNHEGEQVPHAIRVLDQVRKLAVQEQGLPYFPLYANDDSPETTDALALRVERDGSGTIIAIRPPQKPIGVANAPDAGSALPERAIAGYLLDATALPRAIVGLRIELATTAESYVAPVVVEASDDLVHFAAVGRDHALARLQYDGATIGQERFELPATSARYLRVRGRQGALPAPVAGVYAELAPEHAAAELEVTHVAGRARANEPRMYDFDLGGPVPADRVRVLLPEDNTLIEAELASASAPDATFTVVHRGSFYRVMHAEQRLESAPVAIVRRTDRYWRLRVERKGGGLGHGVPTLEVARHPDQLVFVARGTAPFELAYGHWDGHDSSVASDSLLALVPQAARAALPRADVRTSPARTIAGQAARVAPPPPAPIKQYALWAVLVLGVSALGLAAVRMVRQG